jgi:hypothetical protein
MQFIECLIGVSLDGGSGVLELWLFCFAGVMFGLGGWWKYLDKARAILMGEDGNTF